MAEFTKDDDLTRSTFHGVDLSGARFTESILDGAVFRGVDVSGVDIDAPWLLEEGGALWVNGVDVTPYVEAELDRQFPGRSLRHATTPEELRTAWAAVERQWQRTLARAAQLPTGAVEEPVGGEWSFAQTLRHLVMATDLWLGATVRSLERPFHPIGLPTGEAGTAGLDLAVFSAHSPSYDEVLAVRADRVAGVRDYVETVTPEELAQPRRNPWDSVSDVTVLHCLQVVLREEWEHHRFAVRDLAVLEAGNTG